MNVIINFKTDKKIKGEAQSIAKKMGLNLSDVLNIFLRGFVRDKEINISLEESSNWFLNEMTQAKKEKITGNISPEFSDAETAIKWLDDKDRKYAG
jgi:addiction module RelB/DinJ family antitoxin